MHEGPATRSVYYKNGKVLHICRDVKTWEKVGKEVYRAQIAEAAKYILEGIDMIENGAAVTKGREKDFRTALKILDGNNGNGKK
ncbi:MAG: hypothetical protein KAS86_00235 [Candidatus Omnitrophica bacterium]|nr:hypothetical protein [Candidatus Omnitrophota bacterium]